MLLYTRNTQILKLLLNVVSVRIEALVISRNKFLYASIKEVCCELSHILYSEALKKLWRAIQNKGHGMLTSSVLVVLLYINLHPHICTAVCTKHCCSISTGNCFSTLLTALILLWATTTCLTDSLWHRQSQQSFNTLTPFNFLFYSLHVSALMGHSQVRYTLTSPM
jgi:hypothetical protein